MARTAYTGSRPHGEPLQGILYKNPSGLTQSPRNTPCCFIFTSGCRIKVSRVTRHAPIPPDAGRSIFPSACAVGTSCSSSVIPYKVPISGGERALLNHMVCFRGDFHLVATRAMCIRTETAGEMFCRLVSLGEHGGIAYIASHALIPILFSRLAQSRPLTNMLSAGIGVACRLFFFHRVRAGSRCTISTPQPHGPVGNAK